MVRPRRFVGLLCPPLLVLGFGCADGPSPRGDRARADAPTAVNPVAPARTPVVRAPGAGGSENLAARSLDPFSLPAGFHAASEPLTPATTTLPVDETYGGNAGFAFRITQEGSGNGGWFRIRSSTSVNRMALLATHTGEGIAARAINSGSGRAFWAQIPEPSNPFPALVATHVGSGEALQAIAFGVGRAGSFEIRNPSSNAVVLESRTEGSGPAVLATSNGSAVQGVSNAPCCASAGSFRATHSDNPAPALQANHFGDGAAFRATIFQASGDIALFETSNVTMARIDHTGKGFFNGGTQTGGADIAESFAVESSILRYEPGDVLVISETRDRRVERSIEPYSMRVIGVYATKPGVLLSDEAAEAESWGRVPVGVVGVVPTKVTARGGAIGRGDILVTAKLPGHAMKADELRAREGRIPSGAILGKALEPFDGPGTGVIEVMVNVK